MTASNRDDFSESTKRALALRANYRCSFENCSAATTGPSEESPASVTNIGEAAHIHAAAPGGRRYLESMTSEERSHIGNGIWLCVTHSRLIDRDEICYTADVLFRMKREHESRVTSELSGLARSRVAPDFVAIGSNLLAIGKLTGTSGREWRLHVDHFVIGDVASLIDFSERFDDADPYDRYILVNALGDGRQLEAPPEWERTDTGYVIVCRVRQAPPRLSVQHLPTDLALNESHDLFVSGGDIATVSGLSALPQRIGMCLSVQRGESWFNPGYGSRIKEYTNLLKNSSWLPRLIKLEAIRMACVPYVDPITKQEHTPFLCVKRVLQVEALPQQKEDKWLSFHFELDVEGVGSWSHSIAIFIPPDNLDR